MTTDVVGVVPELTLGWRMRMSLEASPLTAQAIAAELGVTRQTISRWTHDEIEPRRIYVKQWAMLTGVPHLWLETGVVPDPSGDGGADDETRTRNILLGMANVHRLRTDLGAGDGAREHRAA